MAISYRYEQICDGAAYTELIDPRLKTNNFYVHILEPLCEENAAANALIPIILSDSNCRYKNLTELSRKLSSLYGADVRGGVSKLADCQVVTLACGCISDKYTIDGEKIGREVLDIFIDCLTSPYLENGVFAEDDFALKKQELIDEIEAEINDKRSYALMTASKLIYDGEPCSVSVRGERSAAEQLTPESVYRRYKELLKTGRIEIIFAGNDISDENKERLFTAIRSLEREYTEKCSFERSKKKSEPVRESERMDIVQSKMVMAYKTDYDNPEALQLFNAVYGGTPFSKLFENVREKLSLCYYCSSGINRRKGTMIIDSGVEHGNINAAEEEIKNQLEAMCSGDFTDEAVENSRLSLINGVRGIGDNPRKTAEWYFRQCLDEKKISPEEEMELIKAVTREDIIKAAKSLVPDTVYILTGKEVKE
ncbi:MAG: insulinase family protein [Oscillospiraceae bacterium]|nr:insulinase family protein [Oscillospiraceae bacterium]